MRFCPFCSAENAAEAVTCAACGRRLPPPPNRRHRHGGPPTGVVLATPTARAAPATAPTVTPVTARVVTAPAPGPTGAPAPVVDDEHRRALTTALVPPPSAMRRSAPPPEPRDATTVARRRSDRPADAPAAVDATVPVDDDWLLDPTEAPAGSRAPSSPALAADTAPTAAPVPDAARPLVIDTPRPRVGATSTAPLPTLATRPPMPPTTVPPAPAATGSAPAPRAARASVPPPVPAAEPAPTPAPPAPVPARPDGDPVGREPPPTRILRTDGTDDRPFIPPTVMPVPEVPDGGILNAGRYAIAFTRARWQRRRAVKLLRAEIGSDTSALDGVLLTLGRETRAAGVDNRILADENQAITDAETRRDEATVAGTEVLGRRAEENAKFDEVERQRVATVSDAEQVVADAQRDVTSFEAQRRSLRDKRKDLERRQKAYLQAASAREGEAEKAPMGDTRAELRRAAEGHRREAASLDPERQDLERKLTALDRPLAAAQAKQEAARAELDGAKRALADVREGHRHRLAELDAEHSRKQREHELIEAEITRRLVTLGTLVNLHRVERGEFAELYQRIDRLRAAINARSTEIDRLVAERTAYDRPALLRGWAVIAGVVVAIIAVVAIILAAT